MQHNAAFISRRGVRSVGLQSYRVSLKALKNGFSGYREKSAVSQLLRQQQAYELNISDSVQQSKVYPLSKHVFPSDFVQAMQKFSSFWAADEDIFKQISEQYSMLNDVARNHKVKYFIIRFLYISQIMCT
jgi:hypothetical protein